MKKLLLAIILFSGCMKAKEKVSDEVLVSVLNQCTATIYLYNNHTGAQYSKDIFDCEYVSVLRIKVAPGTYKVKAETSQRKTVTETFTKSVYAERLDIEF
ncbi:MAG: hypothetical protein KGM16_05240 [Bacteroidota bacterium]|nr:hypothetical protein [Bacteroidota bacterium]